jgi:hypothetical protein
MNILFGNAQSANSTYHCVSVQTEVLTEEARQQRMEEYLCQITAPLRLGQGPASHSSTKSMSGKLHAWDPQPYHTADQGKIQPRSHTP